MNDQKQQLNEREMPEFKKRLHLGHKRSELSYFSLSVLQKYIDTPGKYHVQDTLSGGFISSNDHYLSTLGEEQQQQENLQTVRYGRRTVEGEEQVVTAILEDLSHLPEPEQQHWHLSEIENPSFAIFDPAYHKYHLKFFHCVSVDTHHPIKGIDDILSRINALPNVGKLFKDINTKGLKYPVSKTYQEFCSCCDKLYKLIGPENLNREAVENYLRKHYNYRREDFVNLQSGQPLSNEQLFKKLLKEVGFLTCSVEELIGAIKKRTIPSDHRISASRPRDPDYLTEYKNICESLLVAFSILHQTLEQEMRPTEKV